MARKLVSMLALVASLVGIVLSLSGCVVVPWDHGFHHGDGGGHWGHHDFNHR